MRLIIAFAILATALGFWTHPAFAAVDHIRFQNWSEAKDYYDRVGGPDESAEDDTETPLPILSHDSAMYPRLEAYVAEITAAFYRYFPDDLTNMGVPQLLLIDEADIGGLIGSEYGTGRRPFYILLFKDTADLPELVIKDILAHELVHLFFENKKLGAGNDRVKFYYRDPEQLQFGLWINKDANLQRDMIRYLDLLELMGPFSNAELGGVPANYEVHKHSHYRMLIQLIRTRRVAGQCGGLANGSRLFSEKLVGNFNESSLRLSIPSDEASQELEAAASGFESALRQCFAGVKVSYETLKAEIWRHSEAAVAAQSLLHDTNEKKQLHLEISELFRTKPAIDALIDTNRKGREEMRQIESRYDFSQVRMFSGEDEADERAVYIMVQMGFTPDDWIRDFEFVRGECDFSSEPENYGSIEETHHTQCWRGYRDWKYAGLLTSMSQEDRDVLYRH